MQLAAEMAAPEVMPVNELLHLLLILTVVPVAILACCTPSTAARIRMGACFSAILKRRRKK
jgi:hypothetical protein